jgi:YHS domain-containing protein
MRKIMVLIAALAIVTMIGYSANADCGNCSSKAKSASATKKSSACCSKDSRSMTMTGSESAEMKPVNIIMVDSDGSYHAFCPVHGKSFKVNDKSPVLSVVGHKYYVCGDVCRAAMNEKPEKYLKNLDAKMAQAKKDLKKSENLKETDM